MTDRTRPPSLPPRWVIRAIWKLQRALVRITGGRTVLKTPVLGKGMGLMQVRSIGRTSGEERPVILGYFEDGANLVTLAMNGWAPTDPAWWRNLQAIPDIRVDLKGQHIDVHARAAAGAEHDRLWSRFADYPGWGDLNRFAARRPDGTTVVVLEPR